MPPVSAKNEIVAQLSLSRRALLTTAVGGASLAACAPFKKTSPFWGTLAAGVEGVGANPGISREYTDKLPYASLVAWFDGAPKALLVLAEVTKDGRWIWHSAEGQALITFGPLVVGALGFDLELRSTRLGAGWDKNPLRLAGLELERTLDVVADRNRVQVPLIGSFVRKGVEHVEIMGNQYELERVTESVYSGGRRRYTNDYWVESASGRTWKSRQTVVPRLPVLNVEILKYPS